ncbi:ABC transporter transmembrane domain-containing protein [Paenibacillus rhizoplanae]
MPLQFYSGVKQGEVITRMTSDIAGIQGVFNSTIVNCASNLFILISTAATLFIMNWKLALLGLLVIPLIHRADPQNGQCPLEAGQRDTGEDLGAESDH